MKPQSNTRPQPLLPRILFTGLLLTLASSGAWAGAAPKASEAADKEGNHSKVRQPVLVELFTSEGCSSCPPADALLARLDATQFVAGAQAIVLSEHVTYWNYLGWSDPFSTAEMTQRQSRYASRFGLESVYTPQAVVDGATQVLASDSGAMSYAIAGAAKRHKPDLRIEGAHWNGGSIEFSVKTPKGLHGVLTVALAEDATQSRVGRGENAGRTLHHVAVVRAMKTMVQNNLDEQALSLDVGNGNRLTGDTFRLVAFLTAEEQGLVLAVTECPITVP